MHSTTAFSRSTTPRSIALRSASVSLALWLALTLWPSAAPATPAPTADVDLVQVPLENALRLVAELYDLSVAAAELPETTVTLRLRDVTAADALAALAATAGVHVEPHGSVLFVRASTAESLAASRLAARQSALVEKVYPLGVAAGEETLAAVGPLLDATVESAAYDPVGHRLTAFVLPATVERIDPLLAELTRPPAQYEIEVRLVEVSTSALERMGSRGFFRLEVSGGLLPTTFPLDGLADGARYLPSPNDLATLGDVASGGGSATGGSGELGSLDDSGFRFGRIDGRGVGLLIELLEESGDAKVVATPHVTALDNREARISMVTTLRIPTFTQNQAFATTTVSGIETVDVGTILDVRPRKSHDRQVVLTVAPEVSELESTGAFSLGGLTQGLPVVTRRRTETEVVLETGETLVISGLVRERLVSSLGNTPGLGDLPVVGRAFQHRGEESLSTELLVFLTPRELPPPEERRTKARVDDRWVPAGLARRLEEARAALDVPATRRAALTAFERLDADLLAEGIDVALDVAALRADPDPRVRVAAALFFLRHRPETALLELTRFHGDREVALGVLAEPMAPHLHAAVGELVARSEGGTRLLEERVREVALAGPPRAAGRLLDTLAVVAPERAATVALELADRPTSRLPVRHRLDALAGNARGRDALARHADGALSMEERAVVLAALARSADRPGGPIDARARSASHDPFLTPIAEPAMAWSGSPTPIELVGSRDVVGFGELDDEVARLEAALELLGRRAPDLRHLVGFALARIDARASSDTDVARVDPSSRRAWVDASLPPEALAHTLVRLASLVFEARVHGRPAGSARSLARAVRLEIDALERLTGAPCPPDHADATVRRVLVAAALEGEAP